MTAPDRMPLPAPQLPRAARRLAWAMLLVSLAAAALVLVAISVLGAARAYVAGEGQWSRAQKSAVLALQNYLANGSTAHHRQWREAIAVPLGDRRARQALDLPQADIAAATAGFLAGNNHPDDVPGMIRLYRCCRSLPFMAQSVTAWREADAVIDELMHLAAQIEGAQGRLDAAKRATLRSQLLALDTRLTPLEQRFSDSLGQASRLVGLSLAALLAGGALLVGFGGFVLVCWLARRDAVGVEALARSEALFRSLWDTTDDTVLIVDTDNRIRFANPAADTLFGHPAGTLAGTLLSRLVPERLRAAHEAGMAHHMATGERRLDWRGARIHGLHAAGHELPVEIRFARIELASETLFVGFLRDITPVLAAEQQVQDAQTALEQRVRARTHELVEANRRLQDLDRLKSEFLASMSHELRTPLNSILGFAGVLQQGLAGPLNDEQKRQLGFVRGSGEHLLALINDVLDLSRIESGRMELRHEDFDLADAAQEVVEQLRPLATRKGLALVLERPAALPLRGDRRKTLQVLLNLAGNAVKFTEQGSVRVTLRAGAAGDAEFAVHDTGVGISVAQQALLFQAFRQLDGGLARHHEGTGLGLHLTQRLLTLMGGSIEVDSRPGQGSVFRVWLPLTPPPQPAVQPP
jgi:PAS domain S-box-containing protein